MKIIEEFSPVLCYSLTFMHIYAEKEQSLSLYSDESSERWNFVLFQIWQSLAGIILTAKMSVISPNWSLFKLRIVWVL